jgi:hypothetical protein
MDTIKELSNGVVSKFCTVVKTEMDYNNKSSKATVYYYLDEQAFLDGKEPVMGEVIEVPYVEQEELEKSGVTAKTVAEEAMTQKIEAKVEEKPIEVPV